ncbi:DNA-3-methyladenine glycosylase family protein [Cohnella soli]|uniref:DNA-3-methyladenine glycosylase II n=1 Tax=Cohnella soli TaxID=425005 RepID=A0ABW0I011_9BACL
MVSPLKITVPQEFDFGANLHYLSRSPDESLYRIQDGKLYKAFVSQGKPRLFEVRGDMPGVLLVRSLDEEEWPADTSEEIKEYVKEWFDLGLDLAPFYSMASGDPVLSDVVKRLYGLRNMGIPDLFEALCWGIIGQQITLSFAYTLKRRFVETYGTLVSSQGVEVWLFPTPERIAELDVAELAALKLTGRKAEYLIGVARLIVDGSIGKHSLLASDSFKTAEKSLVAIRGIGPWTANYVLMRCLRYPSAFPIDDVGLHNAIKAVLGMDEKPTVARIRELAVGWEGWEAYATFYLWRVLY